MSITEQDKASRSMTGADLAKEVRTRFASAQAARQPFDPIWEEVSEYMGAAYMGFTRDKANPERGRAELVDSTARRAANVFAAGMLSGAASPSQRWFRLTLQDKEMAEHPQVRAWLQEVEDKFYRTLSQSGFYSQQTLGFHQTGLFGWQCLYVDEDPAAVEGGVRFRALPLEEVYIADNFLGEVDTVFRRFSLTARQAVQKWGLDKVSDRVRRAFDGKGGKDDEFTFLHAVFPGRDLPGVKAAGALPYVSVYLEDGSDKVMTVGGYAELPYIVTRSQRLPGSPYSYSPGTEALADAKMINEMKRLILESGQLSVAPPYLVPDDGFVGRFSFEPRAMNYYRRAEGNSLADFGPLSVGGQPSFSWELMNATKQDINEAFYVDLFLAVKQRAMQGAAPTAREVAELAGERMFLLGPLLVNQQQENFSRLFKRLFALLDKRGEIAPFPAQQEQGMPEVEYVSPLMLAQKEVQTQAVLGIYAEAQSIASVAPEVLDMFDHEENMRRIMDQRGFPQRGIRSRQEVARIRELRAEQAAAQALAPTQAGGA